MTYFFLFLALGSCTPSLQQVQGATKNPIEEMRREAETRMVGALGPNTHPSVTEDALRMLSELEEAGKGDLENIAAFQGPGDKEEAKRKSIQFWKDKMEEVIEPFTTNPNGFQLQVIDRIRVSDDPTTNDTDAYKKIASELNAMSEEASKKLREKLEEKSIPTGRLEDSTETAWKNLEGRRALDRANFFISVTRQQSKHRAAAGEENEAYMKSLTETIEKTSKEFNDKIIEIYK